MPMLDDCLSDFKHGIFSTNEDYRKGLISDNGHMTTIKSYENQSTMGLYIRQDWLDQLGLETPETFDELHDVLVAFKNQIPGCDYPMLLTQNWDYSNNGFVGSFVPPAMAPALTLRTSCRTARCRQVSSATIIRTMCRCFGIGLPRAFWASPA